MAETKKKEAEEEVDQRKVADAVRFVARGPSLKRCKNIADHVVSAYGMNFWEWELTFHQMATLLRAYVAAEEFEARAAEPKAEVEPKRRSRRGRARGAKQGELFK